MHYNIDYSKIPEGRRKAAALVHIRSFLGKERFAKINAKLRRYPPQSPVIFAMAGVQGYPARIWAEYIWKESADSQK